MMVGVAVVGGRLGTCRRLAWWKAPHEAGKRFERSVLFRESRELPKTNAVEKPGEDCLLRVLISPVIVLLLK